MRVVCVFLLTLVMCFDIGVNVSVVHGSLPRAAVAQMRARGRPMGM